MAVAVFNDIIAVIIPEQCERREDIYFSVVLQFFLLVWCVAVVLEGNPFF